MPMTRTMPVGRTATPEEIASYRRDGAVLLRDALPAEWVDLVRDGLEEIRARPDDMTSHATGATGQGEVIIDQYASRRDDRLHRFVQDSPVARYASALLGDMPVRYVIDQTFYKEASYVLPTDWHQDTPYLRVAGNDLVRLWVPCDPSPREVTVRVVKGSHLWNVVYRPIGATSAVREAAGSRFSYGNIDDYDDRLPEVPDIEANPASFDILSWDVEPGDVLAFNGNILHGAGGNFTYPRKRRAFAILWAGDDVRYCKRPGLTIPDMAELSGVDIADGTPLSECPQLFPAVGDPCAD